MIGRINLHIYRRDTRWKTMVLGVYLIEDGCVCVCVCVCVQSGSEFSSPVIKMHSKMRCKFPCYILNLQKLFCLIIGSTEETEGARGSYKCKKFKLALSL
jgi:hypothetical protein